MGTLKGWMGAAKPIAASVGPRTRGGDKVCLQHTHRKKEEERGMGRREGGGRVGLGSGSAAKSTDCSLLQRTWFDSGREEARKVPANLVSAL